MDTGFAAVGLDVSYRVITLNNPINYTDPHGLFVQAVPVICAANPVACIGIITIGIVIHMYNNPPIIPPIAIPIAPPKPPEQCKDDDNNKCERLYQTDTATCNGISRMRGAAAGARCHASASQRYAAACVDNQYLHWTHGITNMAFKTYSHLIEINEEERLLTIYRVSGSDRELYTSVKLPDKTWTKNPEAIKEFCLILGENIILDSPQARKLFEIDKK